MTRVVVFLLGLLACSSRAEIPGLTNRWAVEVRGGPEAANTLARKYGFENRGQVDLYRVLQIFCDLVFLVQFLKRSLANGLFHFIFSA